MDSGELDKKVSFYKAVPVQSGTTGTLTNSPALQTTAWAKMYVTEGAGSSQIYSAGESQLKDEVKWKIRKWASFTPDKTMYILFDSQKYYIHRVKDKKDVNDPFYYISTSIQV